ncbi:hypothetical protein ACWDSL_05475 [Streptomyces sp. NPDC000941]
MLFSVTDRPFPWAVVHLTWTGHEERPPWPMTTPLASLADLLTEWADHNCISDQPPVSVIERQPDSRRTRASVIAPRLAAVYHSEGTDGARGPGSLFVRQAKGLLGLPECKTAAKDRLPGHSGPHRLLSRGESHAVPVEEDVLGQDGACAKAEPSCVASLCDGPPCVGINT